MVAKFCRHCGANITHEGKFCGNCGQLLSAAPTTQEARNTHQASVSSLFPITPETKLKFCKNCGRKVTLNGQLCARCGADLSEPEPVRSIRDNAKEETVVGYTSNVFVGGTLGVANGVLLFTTDRMVVAKASGKAGFAAFGLVGYTLQLRSQATGMASKQGAQIDELIMKNEKNFAIPYSEIAQIRVKLPGGLTKGKVTLKMTTGEKVINISNRGVVGAIKDDWAFLKAPPPKLANKLIVE